MARLGKRLLRTGLRRHDRLRPRAGRAGAGDAGQRTPPSSCPRTSRTSTALVVPVALHENGLPPALTFAGINMAFWPTGALFRRAGRIFIRRDTKDLPVYRWVLREYLGYLVEKRFTLEWYIEGHPLAHRQARPADARPAALHRRRLSRGTHGRRGDAPGVDHLRPAARGRRVRRRVDRVEEEGGVVRLGHEVTQVPAPTPAAGTHLRPLRRADLAPRGGRRGRRHVDDDYNLRLQKLGFEVCTRINAVTPITASALICLILLATRGRAMTARGAAHSR